MQDVADAREHPGRERAVSIAERVAGGLEQCDALAIDRARLGPKRDRAQRGLGELLVGTVAARDLRRAQEARAGRGVARAGLDRREREQQLRVRRRKPVERAPVVRDRLLVGERDGGLLGGLHAIVDGLALTVEMVLALQVVMSELRGGGAHPRTEHLERVGDALMQPHSAAGALHPVQRLPHELVSEQEAIDVVGHLAHEAGVDPLFEREQDCLCGSSITVCTTSRNVRSGPRSPPATAPRWWR